MKTNGNDPAQAQDKRECIGRSRDMYNVHYSGLTKREYFAAMSMQGILSNAEGCFTHDNQKAYSPAQISKLAVAHADELIEALNNEKYENN